MITSDRNDNENYNEWAIKKLCDQSTQHPILWNDQTFWMLEQSCRMIALITIPVILGINFWQLSFLKISLITIT